MDYQTFKPHPGLETIVKCYWTLKVPEQKDTQRQLILPDGCVDMCFTLGDDIKRYTTDKNFVVQPRQMLLGQITEQFYIEPTGCVDTFAVRFYPYGFANFTTLPLHELKNRETPLHKIFGDEKAERLTQQINQAKNTIDRIEHVERFFFEMLNDEATIDTIIKSTIAAMFLSKGVQPLSTILKDNIGKRRQLERNFAKQVGLSPKQLSKVIRLQAALQILLNQTSGTLTDIAYESEYYDQAHFIKDFKEFTGITPKDFLSDEKMALSSVLYKTS